MRMRSPRMAPPVTGELGSMARMAGRTAPEAAASRPVMVDLPVPGAPVTPTTRACPASRWARSDTAAALSSRRSTMVSSRPQRPPVAFSGRFEQLVERF